MTKAKLPTFRQTQILRQLALNGGLMLTLREGTRRYSDHAGHTIEADEAERLIRAGFVLPETDSMFDLAPQSWRVRTP